MGLSPRQSAQTRVAQGFDHFEQHVGFFQERTPGGRFFAITDLRKTVPSR